MARKDQFIKSRTDFVLRDKHTITSKGVIYENDYMTIVPDDGMYDEDVAMFSDSNFKFRIRTDENGKKKHFSGKWVIPDDNAEFWTGENCYKETVTDETKIELKPNYSSIKDFAYYGSATELVKATVRDVLMKFPAGIFLNKNALDYEVNGRTYYVVSNEFDIDVTTKVNSPDGIENPLRMFSLSYGEYLYRGGNPVTIFEMDLDESVCPETIIGTVTIGARSSVRASTSDTFYVYLDKNFNKILLTETKPTENVAIAVLPYKKFISEYEKLDDFSKVLLDLKSKPIFTAKIETPYANNDGYFFSNEKYTWPSICEMADSAITYFTPDMTSPLFDAYVSRLMVLGEFHDEFDSGNLWRMLTHTSIKNLDWTFIREKDGNGEDEFDFDSSRIKAAIELYGRQFDDLKRYTDNIKYSNSITYDEKNNIPDYFITDSVESDGWDAYYVGPSNNDSEKTAPLFSGSTYSGSTSSDANIDFMRRLALNSDYIQSLKGTKRGLETVLGLFGFEKVGDNGRVTGTYEIKEGISIANRFPTESEIITVLPNYDKYYYGDDIYKGWPFIFVSGLNGEESQAIPWYDKSERYNSDFYFQMAGGWEYTGEKKIDLPITTVSAITDTGDLGIYGETLQYMKYAKDLYELTGLTTTDLFEGCVCYVEDITGIENEYTPMPASDEYRTLLTTTSAFSHYFILKNVELAPKVGFVENELYSCYGWKNVLTPEFDGTRTLTCDGAKVLYLESIENTFIGNNPHVGYGKYDDGEEYLNYLKQIFKYEIDNKEFSILSDNEEEMTRIKNLGFFKSGYTIDLIDSKCAFFSDEINDMMPVSAVTGDNDVNTSMWGEDNEVYSLINGCFSNATSGMEKEVKDCAGLCESAAFSVVNLKNIHVTFYTGGNEHLENYINTVVIKYVEQMMPSTAIFGYSLNDGMGFARGIPYEILYGGYMKKIIAEGASVTDTDEQDLFGGWDVNSNYTSGSTGYYEPPIIDGNGDPITN